MWNILKFKVLHPNLDKNSVHFSSFLGTARKSYIPGITREACADKGIKGGHRDKVMVQRAVHPAVGHCIGSIRESTAYKQTNTCC